MPSTVVFPESVVTVVERVRAEFIESPGLSLTPSQAQRLFGVDPQRGASILSGLCDAGFLRRDKEGRFRRRNDG
jgi:hypothetical protein